MRNTVGVAACGCPRELGWVCPLFSFSFYIGLPSFGIGQSNAVFSFFFSRFFLFENEETPVLCAN